MILLVDKFLTVCKTKANSFKRTIKDMEADAERLSEKLETLQ